MIVSDASLRDLLRRGEIRVEPMEPHQVQPASIDLRLGGHFLKVDENSMDVLSLETVRLPGYLTAFVEGRSSIGRIGLFIQNAGWVDPGFEGTITLELYNANRLPIRLQSGRRVCQIVFARLDAPCRAPYAGKYQHQRGTVGSRIYQDADRSGPPTPLT